MEIVRVIERSDATAVADLHMVGLPSLMGAKSGRALLEMYYACVAPNNGGVGFVACEQGRVVGFVVGVWQRHRILRAALRHFPLRFILWIVVEFGWNRLTGLLRRSRGVADIAEHGSPVCRLMGCELRPLVVAGSQRGRGLGARLCGRLLDDAAARGFPLVFLRVDRDNTAAIRCYEKLGFRTHGAEGRWMVMAVDLAPRRRER